MIPVPDEEFSEQEAIALRLDDLVAQCEPEIFAYATRLAGARDDAISEGRNKDAAALQSVVAVATVGLSDDSKQPFTPMMSGNGWRTSLPQDLSEGQCETLQTLLDATNDSELRARIADVLWNKPVRDPNHARIAVSAYLASARRLFDPERWNLPMTRLKRANSIAILLGRESPEFQEVTSELKETLHRLEGNDRGLFSERIMAVLAIREHSNEELGRYRQISLGMADSAEAAGEFQRARAYLACALTWAKALDDQEEFQTLRVRIAETYVSEAQAKTSNIARSSILRRAVLELREAGSPRERIEHVRAMLDDSQVVMLTELR
jgi:hypothetical protein